MQFASYIIPHTTGVEFVKTEEIHFNAAQKCGATQPFVVVMHLQ